MLLARAILHPTWAISKVKQYGFGRVVYDRLKPYPTLSWHARPLVRAAKIAVDPIGYLRRRYLAWKLCRGSVHADYFPHDTAFRVAPPGTFDGVDRIIPIARDLYRSFLQHYPSGQMDKSSYSYLLYDHKSPPDGKRLPNLIANPDFQDLATYRPFVEMACKYLGEVPIVGEVDYQVVMPNDHTEGFQKFHIDGVSNKQLKIFIPVEDVDEDNGATVIIPADKSAEIARSIGYRTGRIPDDVIYSDRWKQFVQNAAGPAGSAAMFDTCRAIHCGARTRGRPRLLIMLSYTSKYTAAENPLQLGHSVFDRARANADPISQLLFNLR